jgi:hypothetical protein
MGSTGTSPDISSKASIPDSEMPSSGFLSALEMNSWRIYEESPNCELAMSPAATACLDASAALEEQA